MKEKRLAVFLSVILVGMLLFISANSVLASNKSKALKSNQSTEISGEGIVYDETTTVNDTSDAGETSSDGDMSDTGETSSDSDTSDTGETVSGSDTVVTDTTTVSEPVSEKQTTTIRQTETTTKKTVQTGFVIKGKYTYYYDKNGKAVTGKKKIGKYTYYFSTSGKMLVSKFKTINGKKYYFDKKGHMVTGKKKIGKYTYYFSDSGKMVVSKFKKINGYKYYFNKSGHMVTGKKKIGKYTYYFSSGGKMAVSKFKTIDGKKYYFNKSGHMVTGRKKIKGNLYYFNSKGVLYRTVYANKKMVALTYDDGPSKNTETILDTLEKYDSVATFFVVGNRVSSYSSSVKRAYKMGCQIGSHTYSHAILTRSSVSGIKKEIKKTKSAIKKATGKKPTIMRPPGGSYNSTVKKYVGTPIILWSIDTLDWKTRNKGATVRAVVDNVKDGDIVLMHDLYESTAEASKSIIPKLINEGYQLVTVEEMALLRGGMEKGEVYYSFRK